MRREISDRGRRILGVVTLVFAVLIIGGVVLLLRPRGGNAITVATTAVPADSVVYYSSRGFFLVRDGDEFLAFRDNEPGANCRVTWRPDLVTGSSAGAFQSPCTGRTYDRGGRPISDGQPLQKLRVETSGGEVTVDPGRSAEG